MIDPEGRPLLSRTYGGMPAPPFPTVALLSTCASFAENVGMALRRVATEDVRAVFRRARGGLLFVVVSSDVADAEGHLQGLLKRCEDVATLVSGRAALDCGAKGNGPQRQKPLLRAVCPAFDRILEEQFPMPSVVLGTQHVLPNLNNNNNSGSDGGGNKKIALGGGASCGAHVERHTPFYATPNKCLAALLDLIERLTGCARKAICHFFTPKPET